MASFRPGHTVERSRMLALLLQGIVEVNIEFIIQTRMLFRVKGFY